MVVNFSMCSHREIDVDYSVVLVLPLLTQISRHPGRDHEREHEMKGGTVPQNKHMKNYSAILSLFFIYFIAPEGLLR